MDDNLRQTIEDLTFGTPERLVGLVAWRVLDSMISTVPSGICLVATWMLVQPVINPGTPLDTGGGFGAASACLWCRPLSRTSRHIDCMSCHAPA